MKRLKSALKGLKGAFMSVLPDTFKCINKFKVVRMHEKHTGVKHSLLYQFDKVPADHAIITREIEDVYDLPKGTVVIDSIAPYIRRKNAPLHPPTAESLARNARLSSETARRASAFRNQFGYPVPVDLPRLPPSD